MVLTAVCGLPLASCLEEGALPGDGNAPRVAAAENPPPAVRTIAALPDPAPEASAAPAVRTVEDDPDRLRGLDRTSLEALLGEPGFIRRDEPARIWRYRHESCVLDLFLYAEPGRDGPSYRVRHVEARAGERRAASARGCLRALLIARPAPAAG